MGLLGIVLFLTLWRKTASGKQAAPAIDVDIISSIYDEVDKKKTGTAVPLRSMGNLQTITEPDPTYEAIDDSDLDSKCGPLHMNVLTAFNPAYGVSNIATSDVCMDSNPAYGVSNIPSSDEEDYIWDDALPVNSCKE